MAGKRSPAKPEVMEEVNLRGKMGSEIARMIGDGEVSEEYAFEFVADRAVRKLQREIDKLGE